jgi:RNA polymerase sigma-70 factor (ECF subfamily)
MSDSLPGPSRHGAAAPESINALGSAMSPSPHPEESRLVAALRQGDEKAFAELVERYHSPLTRLARLYVPSQAVAEEVVQETWLGVLQGLRGFEGRSSLKTWIFRILMNRARTRGEREGRMIPFSVAFSAEGAPDEPAVDPERFLSADHPQWPGHWASAPQPWNVSPEELALSAETRGLIENAIAALPASQREVITLRDVEQWTSEEVCNALQISETNQRVLLHRARAKVRRALEAHLERKPGGSR